MLVAPVGVHRHVESLHAALWNRPSGQLATTVVYGSRDPWLATDMEPLVAAMPGAVAEVFQGATAFANSAQKLVCPSLPGRLASGRHCADRRR
jgi:hypothetical protein